ncbi:hypothetical protein CWR48_06030 [Oceanobacillus arenosus]|uniref:Uncharacterized protein n=1 Tax=Oceanobacillus arenosus TaxID=1229153 RepID=A0A3D8PVV1_9BACI|nr:hypothetical protein [Oceanobacillus arenosus]RDW20256.1 hypothetical protein CWR48_06030 [Oceanobacillus arenosus]
MRKLGGIVIIIFSLLLAFSGAISFQEDIIFASIVFWLISLPLYISGQIIRTSKSEFKHRGKHWVSIYIFFFFILPLLFYLYEFYNHLKEDTFVNEQFIIYEPASGILGDLSLGVFLILISLFAGRFLNPGLKRKGLLNAMIIGTLIFLAGFNYFIFSDYRGIHEDKGLVSSNWKGEEQIISYEEIASVHVEPYVHYANLSSRSDETRFVWKVIFQSNSPKNEVVYHFSGMSEFRLEQTIDLRKIAMENNIPFIMGDMSQETVKWFDLDLELEELDKERYYELFQVNYK